MSLELPSATILPSLSLALPALTLVIGLPGSGKTTFLEQIRSQSTDPKLLIFDDFIHKWYDGEAQTAISHGDTHVVLSDLRLCHLDVLETFLSTLRRRSEAKLIGAKASNGTKHSGAKPNSPGQSEYITHNSIPRRYVRPVIVFIDTDPMICLERLRQRTTGIDRDLERSLWMLVKSIPTPLPLSYLPPDQYCRLYLTPVACNGSVNR
jgi:hypothetical protein